MSVTALPPGKGSRVLQTLAFMRDPTAFFLEQQAKHGPIFSANLHIGEAVVTGDAGGLKEIFGADPDTFDVLSQRPLIPIVGKNSMLVTAGRAHRRKRKLLMPPFHGERMRAYGQLMQTLALEAFDGHAPGTPFRAIDITTDLSLEVIIRAVFGVTDPERAQRFRGVLGVYVESYTPLLASLPAARRSFGGFGPWARFRRHAVALEKLLHEELALRRASDATHEDILSLLLAARDEDGEPMPDEEVMDELKTLLSAGHETTAISMAWALHHLHRHPEALSRVLAEIDALGAAPTPEALAAAPFLGAVCDETLRLHPVVVVVGRRTLAPFTLQGHALPVGTAIMASINLAHANPDHFPEPDRFLPERFLGQRYTPFQFLPFGGGARRCIGAAFANYEMRVILGTLLATRRFSADGSAPERPMRRNVTLGPSRGVTLIDEGPRSTL